MTDRDVAAHDRVDVVTHVHWDREWYRTFDGFRARLVELVDAVLDQLESGQLETFLLDGQTSVVDDHLEVRPDAEPRIAAHVAAGRLRIGPWYVLADKTLVSGEALIRNLLVGTARAHELGGRTDVGYCPDMFGHPPELPMVLRGFGIDTAVVWRGADPDVPVFRWRSPDGSEVMTRRERYYEPEVLWGTDGVGQRLAAWIAARRATQPAGPLLLLNGGDHLAPRDLGRRLAALDDDPDTEVVLRQTTLDEHLRALDTTGAPTVTGALRHPGRKGAFLLAGTLSVRPRQKRANADAQALLEAYAEPLVARAVRTPEPVGEAQELTTSATLVGLLATAWRHLLQSHPHDSVCGCGTDTVAADTSRRLAAALEVGEQVVARAGRRLGLPVGPAVEPDHDLAHAVVLNPTAQAVGGVVDLALDLPVGRAAGRIGLPNGEHAPFHVQAVEVPDERLVTDIATLPGWPRTQRHHLRIAVPEVAPSGWTTLRVELVDGPAVAAQGGSVDAPAGASGDADTWTIAGGHLRVTAGADGTFSCTDGRTGRTVSGIGRLVDTGDRGDLYNHDAPVDDNVVVARCTGVQRRVTPVGEELHVSLTAELPVSLEGEQRDVRAAAITPLTATLVARLATEAQQVELRLRFTTAADDHRLRLHVPTGATCRTFVTDSGFTWQEHDVPTAPVPDLPDGPGEEADPGTQPTQRFVAAGDGAARVAVLVHGHHEVAAVPTQDSTELVVTLHRAVRQLGQHDLRTRTMGAGPPIPTPLAQEHGTHELRCAVRLGDGGAALVDAAWRWRAPLRAAQLAEAPAPDAVERVGIRIEGGQLSAWKPAHDGDGWIVRIANPMPHESEVAVHLPVTAGASPCRLDEGPLDTAGTTRYLDVAVAPAEAAAPVLRAQLPPGGIASWRVRPR